MQMVLWGEVEEQKLFHPNDLKPMKEFYSIGRILIYFIIIIPLLMLLACADRQNNPVVLADSTIRFLPKSPDGINATITLCRFADRKSGLRVDPGTSFSIADGENILAVIDIENRFLYGRHLLMFHIDWVDDRGKSVFVKRIDLLPGDSATSIQSAISVSPGRRKPGKYSVRIYLFRELIAYKAFEVLEEYQLSASQRKEIMNNLIVYQNIDKKTGKSVDEGANFTISDKRWIRATLDLEDAGRFEPYRLIFTFDWIGPDGKSFYKKQATFPPEDSSTVLRSSVSASPEVRQPGEYKLLLYLFGNLIAEKPFVLTEKSVQKAVGTKKYNASLILCRTDDYTTCLSEPPVTIFQAGQKERAYAFAVIQKLSQNLHEMSRFSIVWTDSSGHTLFSKRFEINPGESPDPLVSSISISPDKRQRGLYFVRLYHGSTLLAGRKFKVR
jgi:hypothetical protein